MTTQHIPHLPQFSHTSNIMSAIHFRAVSRFHYFFRNQKNILVYVSINFCKN